MPFVLMESISLALSVFVSKHLCKMKAGIFFMLCCFGVHYSISIEQIDSEGEVTQKPTNVEYKTEDLEDLDLLQLLNVALTNETARKRANLVYYEKNWQKIIEITHVREEQQFSIYKSRIFIDYGLAENFLKAFSESIDTITIAYTSIPRDKHQEIGGFVNLYCFESLMKFRTINCPEGAFNKMEKPFVNVVSVTLNGVWREKTGNSLGLDELFPDMETLTLTSFDGFIANHQFSNLKYLFAEIEPSSYFTQIIKKNPQIINLSVQETSMEFLKAVSENQPLRDLAFNVPKDLKSYSGPILNFYAVLMASISDLNNNFKNGKLVFHQLRHLDLLVLGEINDEWIEFIGKNKLLLKLTTTSGYFNNQSLLKLSNNLTTLFEGNINCGADIKVESVVEFIEKNKELFTITLNIPRGSVSFFENLKNKLENKMRVTLLNQAYSSFLVEKLKASLIGWDDSENSGNSTTPGYPPTSPSNGASYISSATVLFVMVLLAYCVSYCLKH